MSLEERVTQLLKQFGEVIGLHGIQVVPGKVRLNQDVDINGTVMMPEQGSAASTPETTHRKIYPKADGWYDLDDAGNEVKLAEYTGGGSATQGTFLVSGGQVTWVSGYTYTVAAGTGYINGTFYGWAQQNITLDAADATYNRIDVIAVDNTETVVKITGTAADDPTEPVVDVSTQLQLAFILVTANSSAPTVTTELVYKDNNGSGGTPAEWNWTTSGTGINVNSSTNPRGGSGKDIEGTNMAANAYAQGQKGTGTIDPNTFAQLVLFIRFKAAWSSSRYLRISLQNAGVKKGNALRISGGYFGLDGTNLTDYQAVIIPCLQFAVPPGTLINQVRIQDVGGAIGFYIDDVYFTTGGTGGGGGASGMTQDEADARYIKRGGTSTDNAVARYNGTAGDQIQTSLATVDDSGGVNIPSGQTYNINGSAHTHALSNHDHSGDTGDGGQFPLVNLQSTGATVNQVPLADGSGGIDWGNQSGGMSVRFAIDGRLSVLAGVGGVFVAPTNITISSVYIYCSTLGTASSTIIDIHKNGTTIFTTQGNRPTLAYNDGDKVAKAGTPNVTDLTEYDVLTIDIDQVATGAEGLTVIISTLASTSYSGPEVPPSNNLNGSKLGTGTDNVVLALGGGGAWDSVRILHPWAVEYNGIIYLYFTGNDADASTGWQIGVATANKSGFTGVNFTKYGSNPILVEGAGGTWDASGVFSPVVIYDPDENLWKMWYTGQNASGTCAIGYATASDPLGPWTKYGSNPVLSAAGSGWEETYIGWFSILRENASTYKMLYTGGTIASGSTFTARIGLATSTDGISWTKYDSNPVITQTGSGWEQYDVFSPRTLIKVSGTYYIYYSGKATEPANNFSKSGIATSTDLINWTRGGSNPILTADRTWEGTGNPPGETENVNYVQIGTTQYIFYDAWWGSLIGVVVIP